MASFGQVELFLVRLSVDLKLNNRNRFFKCQFRELGGQFEISALDPMTLNSKTVGKCNGEMV